MSRAILAGLLRPHGPEIALEGHLLDDFPGLYLLIGVAGSFDRDRQGAAAVFGLEGPPDFLVLAGPADLHRALAGFAGSGEVAVLLREVAVVLTVVPAQANVNLPLAR